MAFQTNAVLANNVSPFAGREQATQNENWRSDAFVNMSLPYEKEDGTQTQIKLGAIQLKLSRQVESAVIAMFKEDPEGAAERLRKALVFDFREAGVPSKGKLLL